MAQIRTLLAEGAWYKGNLHMHTTESDGRNTPQQAVELYKNGGYDFISLTDHCVYGIHSELQTDDFLIFPGTELDTKAGIVDSAMCHHIVAFSTPEKNEIPHGESLKYTREMSANEIIKEMNARGQVCIYAHPRWSMVTMEEFDRIDGYLGLEILNHACQLDSGNGNCESYWEHLLWHGRKAFCFGTDDSHATETSLGGYIVVKAREFTHNSIMESILAGSFYASSGPGIHDFYIEDGVAHLKTSPCRTIGILRDSQWGAGNAAPGLKTELAYRLPEGVKYVYGYCVDESGYCAWTQPLWLG